MNVDVVIPDRALFTPTEVCGIVGVQPYVLKSWQAEFPGLGSSKKKDGTRIYRRAEVELVLQIKHLLFVDGLTLGAARRQLEGESTASLDESGESLEKLFSRDARERLVEVRRGLQDILKILSGETEAKPRVRADVVAKALRGPVKKSSAARKGTRPSRVKAKGATKRKRRRV